MPDKPPIQRRHILIRNHWCKIARLGQCQKRQSFFFLPTQALQQAVTIASMQGIPSPDLAAVVTASRGQDFPWLKRPSSHQKIKTSLTCPAMKAANLTLRTKTDLLRERRQSPTMIRPGVPIGVASSLALGGGGAVRRQEATYDQVQNLHHGGWPGKALSSQAGYSTEA
jgi:hypothetical protein